MSKLLILLLACSVVLVGCTQTSQVGCGGTSGMQCGMSHSMAPVTSEYVFIRDMIPHHQEAIDTAKLTLETTQNEELKQLLREIISAQEKEVTQMNGWLDAWHPGQSKVSNYQPMMGDLKAVNGVDRDKLFLAGMIMHHEMAVQMASEVIALRPREEVQTFAENVIGSQSVEIAQMKALLSQYPGAPSAGMHMMPDGTMMHNGMMH